MVFPKPKNKIETLTIFLRRSNRMALAVVGTMTTMMAGSITQAWADVILGTEGPDELVDTP